jgi:group I intron endonuclease
MAIIYVLENKINGKCYVGQTKKSFEYRIKRHKKRKNCIKIHNAIKKYGLINFNKYIFYIPEYLLDYFEIEMIKRLDSINKGYNLTSGGSVNRYISKETREKLSIIATKRMSNKFNREKLSRAVKKAYREDPSIIEKIKKIHKGSKRNKETKRKMSEAQKGRIPSNKIYNSKEEKRKANNKQRRIRRLRKENGE